jgi:2-dehydro-3-deoxyphosphogluconate aldolase / (4S)-4-hydroxy-2-oxoglutarate aldolase
MDRSEISSSLVRGRIIAIVRATGATEAVELGRVLIEAGMPAVEVALTTPDGIRAIADLADSAPTDRLIGAGTVLDAESARLAVLAGARFLVAPVVVAEVVRVAHRYGAAAIPGAATPTEVLTALETGADLVKLFPAAQLGIGYLEAIKTAIPQAALVPTGGVDADNARTWLDAGAAAVGVGGALTQGGPAEVHKRAREILAAVAT